MKLQLIGTAGEIKGLVLHNGNKQKNLLTFFVLAAPSAAELQQEEEKPAEAQLERPIGLQNLGNTCYMNSTLQCLRKIPELRDGLRKIAPGGDEDKQLAIAASNLFRSMESAKDPQPPFGFLQKLHSKYPQFAEKGPEGGLMQVQTKKKKKNFLFSQFFLKHDAEECWNAVLMSLARAVPKTTAKPGEIPSQENSLISELFQGFCFKRKIVIWLLIFCLQVSWKLVSNAKSRKRRQRW